MSTDHARHVLLAVQAHPSSMSPILLEYLLRGESIGRMKEKGLDVSPHRAMLADVPNWAVAEAIMACLTAGWLAKAAGFYPALRLTPAGEAQLAAAPPAGCAEAAPDAGYRAYHRWRQGVARQRRTPAYRVLPNAILSALAARRPQSLDQLLQIPGLGKRRALRYQHGLVAVGLALRAPGEG